MFSKILTYFPPVGNLESIVEVLSNTESYIGLKIFSGPVYYFWVTPMFHNQDLQWIKNLNETVRCSRLLNLF